MLPERAHRIAALSVREEVSDRSGQCRHIFGGHEIGDFAANLARRRQVARDHGSSGGHTFQHRKAEALAPARHAHHCGFPIQPCELLIRDMADETDTVEDVSCMRSLADLVSLPTVGPGEHCNSPGDLPHCLDQYVLALANVERANRQCVWATVNRRWIVGLRARVQLGAAKRCHNYPSLIDTTFA